MQEAWRRSTAFLVRAISGHVSCDVRDLGVSRVEYAHRTRRASLLLPRTQRPGSALLSGAEHRMVASSGRHGMTTRRELLKVGALLTAGSTVRTLAADLPQKTLLILGGTG